jgi:hypothetical protein
MENFTDPRFREATNGEGESLTRLERSANLRALGHIFPSAKYPYPTNEVRERWHGVREQAAVRPISGVGTCRLGG